MIQLVSCELEDLDKMSIISVIIFFVIYLAAPTLKRRHQKFFTYTMRLIDFILFTLLSALHSRIGYIAE
jgi:uncharacterized membrane protein